MSQAKVNALSKTASVNAGQKRKRATKEQPNPTNGMSPDPASKRGRKANWKANTKEPTFAKNIAEANENAEEKWPEEAMPTKRPNYYNANVYGYKHYLDSSSSSSDDSGSDTSTEPDTPNTSINSNSTVEVPQEPETYKPELYVFRFRIPKYIDEAIEILEDARITLTRQMKHIKKEHEEYENFIAKYKIQRRKGKNPRINIVEWNMKQTLEFAEKYVNKEALEAAAEEKPTDGSGKRSVVPAALATPQVKRPRGRPRKITTPLQTQDTIGITKNVPVDLATEQTPAQ